MLVIMLVRTNMVMIMVTMVKMVKMVMMKIKVMVRKSTCELNIAIDLSFKKVRGSGGKFIS